MTTENMNCPFCAGIVDPEGWLRGDGVRGPECNDCGATAGDIGKWNTRASSSSPEAIAQHAANLRALDVALNGEFGAASAPSLVDILAQVQTWRNHCDRPLMAMIAAGQRWLAVAKAATLNDEDGNEVLTEWVAEHGDTVPTVDDLDMLADRLIAKKAKAT